MMIDLKIMYYIVTISSWFTVYRENELKAKHCSDVHSTVGQKI